MAGLKYGLFQFGLGAAAGVLFGVLIFLAF